ncbi:MAG: RNA-binding protein [Deltaproteobacteria bacterium]|nr:RNA-binding protein [Deltaproteobacteria bacterium]
MGMKLYVGNLSYDTTEADLQAYFAKAGEVESAKIITDRDTGRSRGFAFVEMRNVEDGKKAIGELDGTALGNRNIKVTEAKPREDRPRGGGGGGYGGGGGGGGGGGYGRGGRGGGGNRW